VPKSLLDLIHYTGYVTRSAVMAKSEARAQLGVDPNARLVVASFGGGQGTESLWHALLNSLERIAPCFDLAYFAAGPYLETDGYERLRQRVTGHPGWTWSRLLDPLPVWMAASDLFIGSGGYNSLAEIVSMSANALIIPRQLREREQALHAARLAALGMVRVVDLETVMQVDISPVLEMCLREPFPISGKGWIRTDGAVKNTEMVAELISQG
jgi:predicted glycosyltransferase